jgi:hypothetical protein
VGQCARRRLRHLESARYSCQHIPAGRFLGFDSGDHVLLDHPAAVRAEVEALLRDLPQR